MGSSSAASAAPSPEFIAAFRARSGADERMPFADFMRLALYDPQAGYYRRERPRVGYGPGTDFFTASTSGPLFGELIAEAAAETIRGRGGQPEAHMFVELGAETPDGILAGVAHRFRGARTVRLGEPADLRGPCVVFSNELFDAQPFDRFVRTDEGWCEVMVRLDGGQLREELRPARLAPFLPAEVPSGYRLDAPREAARLAAGLADESWHGLFLAFDYGKAWAELATETPHGTARAYFRHTQSNDLLARPGEQDLTCHVCWDWIAEALRERGFEVDPVMAQEAFLIRRASGLLERQVQQDATRLTRRKLSLMQLLHPAHLGRKFQVLSAWRCVENCPCTG